MRIKRFLLLIGAILGGALGSGCFPVNVLPVCALETFACGDDCDPFPFCAWDAFVDPICPLHCFRHNR